MDDSSSLRRILLDEITSLRAGTTDPTRAKAVAALANQVLKSVEVEMAFIELANGAKTIPALGGMKLVSEAPGNILENTKTDPPEPRGAMLPPVSRVVRGQRY